VKAVLLASARPLRITQEPFIIQSQLEDWEGKTGEKENELANFLAQIQGIIDSLEIRS